MITEGYARSAGIRKITPAMVAYTSDRVFVYFMPKGRRGVLGGTAIPVPYDTLRSLSGKRATDLDAEISQKGCTSG